MQEKTKIILAIFITMITTLSITTYAVFRASAEHITLDIDKTEKENVKESLDELYDMAESSGCPDNMVCLGYMNTTNSTKKCRRAKSLHREVCEQADTSNYCSSTDINYSGTDIVNGSNIVYGNITITNGVLKTGDAFTCDVNGDGLYDEVAERFYYVSDLYTSGATGSETFDSNYAVLIYYNNTRVGEPDNTSDSLIAYNANNVNNKGPVTGVANLPSTIQWKNVNLKNQTRQIRTETGTTSTSAGAISSFTYTDKAARLITAQEINKACGITVGNMIKAELDISICRFLLENTKYSNSLMGTWGYWLETPSASTTSTIWYTNGDTRRITTYHSASYTSNYGVRPVIEVLKTDIAY